MLFSTQATALEYLSLLRYPVKATQASRCKCIKAVFVFKLNPNNIKDLMESTLLSTPPSTIKNKKKKRVKTFIIKKVDHLFLRILDDQKKKKSLQIYIVLC